MKVKELIEELNKLDQDKGIWIAYDYPCRMYDPVPDMTADEECAELFKKIGVEEGDYIIYVD